MIPREKRGKLEGYDFWNAIGKPRTVLAPMVDVSDLPYRLLCLKHGTELCYSPMFNVNTFLSSVPYRKECMLTCEEDKPLFIQLAGDDPCKMLEVAKMVEKQCDAIDINFGCPQNIAKRGHYGAYLQDEWDLMRSLVSTLHDHLTIPVTAKYRKQKDTQRTIKLGEMLVDAGAQVICLHGRVREQRGVLSGHADWDEIKIVREYIHVPFIANGAIYSMRDALLCLRHTKADAVMSGVGLRNDPLTFSSLDYTPERPSYAMDYPKGWENCDSFTDKGDIPHSFHSSSFSMSSSSSSSTSSTLSSSSSSTSEISSPISSITHFNSTDPSASPIATSSSNPSSSPHTLPLSLFREPLIPLERTPLSEAISASFASTGTNSLAPLFAVFAADKQIAAEDWNPFEGLSSVTKTDCAESTACGSSSTAGSSDPEAPSLTLDSIAVPPVSALMAASFEFLSLCQSFHTTLAFARDRVLRMHLSQLSIHYDIRDRLPFAPTISGVAMLIQILNKRISEGLVPKPAPPRVRTEDMKEEELLDGVSLFG
ncbi:putative t-diRNAhydrouridine synthase [Monocercomonoides exilis]|uniref:putative t-diRNAhydrouridine synthase n=1 Tax=Monocercomonoides exilis TaxID=2049356 RepID=UPI00355AA56F|nr:putative t-diRNAhydrouridine synthase [Monocercomonoides exilis]|eukprot:MONOS_6117.1-p1 / transcript=MONOS_6117.1 / gene=MONOS_6117 / organism=Monocercomonoides_exilis_PA203 / gene_product=GI15082 / transcript_product=GI15082 / location=Mono_scaffold00188:71369-73386(+) / protein_length=538 / sequence_SO=supercontig / SO=protein_coding / is_pseudo=false